LTKSNENRSRFQSGYLPHPQSAVDHLEKHPSALLPSSRQIPQFPTHSQGSLFRELAFIVTGTKNEIRVANGILEGGRQHTNLCLRRELVQTNIHVQKIRCHVASPSLGGAADIVHCHFG
jgi:hypothetical protein